MLSKVFIRYCEKHASILSLTLLASPGTDGFIHVASPLNGEDPKIVIPTAVNGALNALKASAKTPGIKRVVYTSSSIAATFPKPNVQFEINDKSWNEEGITKGWNHPKDEPEILKGLYLYAALKTETEKACWKWVEENKPGFVFNSIVSLSTILRWKF